MAAIFLVFVWLWHLTQVFICEFIRPIKLAPVEWKQNKLFKHISQLASESYGGRWWGQVVRLVSAEVALEEGLEEGLEERGGGGL